MFLSNLSTASERQARKQQQNDVNISSITETIDNIQKLSLQNNSNDINNIEIPTFLDEIGISSNIQCIQSTISTNVFEKFLQNQLIVKKNITLNRGNKDIKYSKEKESLIPRDILLDYLFTCSAMILEKENILEIIQIAVDSNIGLQAAAVVYQQDVLEYKYHIERTLGCLMLSRIPQMYSNDLEMINASNIFIFSAMRSYLLLLNIRGKQQGIGKINQGDFPSMHILEFFEACNALSKCIFFILYDNNSMIIF